MEYKGSLILKFKKIVGVSIVPIWNIKSKEESAGFTKSDVSIVPIWNIKRRMFCVRHSL